MNKIENRAKKILKWIDEKNYSQEELLSFNYSDLICNLHMKLFKKPLVEDEFYMILQMIIENCTCLDADDFTYLFYGGAATVEILITAIQYKTDFNFQMAQYFDESII